MADDPYVPVGGWDAAGYSGFAPSSNIPQQQYGITPQSNYQPQGLLGTPEGNSLSTLRGWSPDPNAYGNSGPQLQGGSWAGLVSQAYQHPNATPTGGGGIMREGGSTAAPPPSPYGDLSGVPAMTPPNPYGDLSGSRPQNPYGDLSGVPAMPSPFGDLSGSQGVATGGAGAVREGYQPQPTYASPAGGASLGGNHPFDLNNFQNSYPPQPMQMPASENTPTITPTSFAQNGATMPGASPYGGLLGSSMPSPNPPNPYGDLSGVSHEAPASPFGSLSGVSPAQITSQYTGGAGLQSGTQSAFAPSAQGAQFDGSQNNSAFDQPNLPQTPSPAAVQAGRDVGATQYSSYPLDRSQVPPSVVAPGTSIDQLPFPNDDERMRLMRTVNGEDPANPEAVLWSIKNRLATQQQPGEARYGNQIGTGLSPLNNGTDTVTRGNQYNVFSQAGYNRENFANNVAAFNDTNPNYQRYSDAIDKVWSDPSSADPTSGATNYFNPNTSQPAWQQQLAQQNSQQIGAHTYVGQTPMFEPPMPPPRPDYLNPTQPPAPYDPQDRFAGVQRETPGLLGGLR